MLRIDARNSRFIDYGDSDSSGLMFRWECDNTIQEYCDEWAGSPILQISEDLMERYGFPIVLNKFYEFKVVVSSIGEG